MFSIKAKETGASTGAKWNIKDAALRHDVGAPKRNANLDIDISDKDKLILLRALFSDENTEYDGYLACAARSILYIGPMRRSLVTMSDDERKAAIEICNRTIPTPEWSRTLRDFCISVICGEDARYIDCSSEYSFSEICYGAFFEAIDTANYNDPQSAKDFVGGIKMAAVDFLNEGIYAAAQNAVNMLSYVEKKCKGLINAFEEDVSNRLFAEKD